MLISSKNRFEVAVMDYILPNCVVISHSQIAPSLLTAPPPIPHFHPPKKIKWLPSQDHSQLMNIHSSLLMAVYIISRDAAGDGSGLIIKSSFNCILLHYNDVSKLARLALSLCICTVCGFLRGGGHVSCHLCLLPQLIWRNIVFCCFQDLQWIRRQSQAQAGLKGVCRDACRSEDRGKHVPNPSWGLTLLTLPLFWRLQHFLVSAGVPTLGCQVHL